MRALVVTNMYPSPGDPARGSFVRDQVVALRRLPGLEVELFTFPSLGPSAYLRAAGAVRRRYRGSSFDVVHAHIPRIDTHIYSRENGWAINALVTLYAVSGARGCLDEAIRAANWVCAYRALSGGGFRHDDADSAGPYLGDSLSMGRAFLTLYECTADRVWLQRAERAVKFIAANFASSLGYITCAHNGALAPKPQLDENVGIVRLANLLWHYTGNSEYRDMAVRAMSFLAAPGATDHRGFLVAGVLLADREIIAPPLHITVVGRKDDKAGQMLFAAALLGPATYKRVEWLDEREGPLPNLDVEYPTLSRTAAFLCTANACSAPIFTADDLIAKTNKH